MGWQWLLNRMGNKRQSHRGWSWTGKGGDGDDDADHPDHKDDDGHVNDDAQVVRGVPEEQRLRGDRGDRTEPVGLSFQVRKLHCPGESIFKIILIIFQEKDK